jgi:hypothetical protein
VLVEVDDLLLGGSKDDLGRLRADLEKRFSFGKWKEDQSDFAGRRIRWRPECILVDQKKYVLEQIHPVKLGKGLAPTDALSSQEYKDFRSLIYKLSWVGKESRPEDAGAAALLAQALPRATRKDAMIANKMVKYLRSTASQCITIWAHHHKNFQFVSMSDSGGVGSDEPVQNSLLILAADRGVESGRATRASVLAWRSTKCKRVVNSSLAGEAIATSAALAGAEWLQVMYRDICWNDVEVSDWSKALLPLVAIRREDCELHKWEKSQQAVDAKSVYDALQTHSPGSRQDRRSALELSMIRSRLRETGSTVRWIPHPLNPADMLTKADAAKANDALSSLLRTGRLCLSTEEAELRRKAGSSKAASRVQLRRVNDGEYLVLRRPVMGREEQH